MCGVVAGAVMAIGILRGRARPDDNPKECYGLARRFLEDFTARFGTVSCRALTGCDLTSRSGRRALTADGIRDRTCRALLEWAVGELTPLLPPPV